MESLAISRSSDWSKDFGSPQGAWISPCQLYRTLLWRTFTIGGDAASLVFVMLNPSTADCANDDPTIRRCLGFAQREGMGGIIVVNLSPYRTSNPKDLRDSLETGIDVIKENTTQEVFEIARKYGPFVLAWGASIPKFLDSLARLAKKIGESASLCLGKTKMEEPRHPLFVRKDSLLVPFIDL